MLVTVIKFVTLLLWAVLIRFLQRVPSFRTMITFCITAVLSKFTDAMLVSPEKESLVRIWSRLVSISEISTSALINQRKVKDALPDMGTLIENESIIEDGLLANGVTFLADSKLSAANIFDDEGNGSILASSIPSMLMRG